MKGALFLLLIGQCLAQASDRIIDLPYLKGKLGSQYSGYINVNETTGNHMHYWFVESFGNPATDPLVLWLNGGPGCSSLDGYLYEQGPFKFSGSQEDLTLVSNPWTWTSMANMIFLEAPVGVGFSYSDTPSEYATSDTVTAHYNHMFLRKFLQKYPAYKNHQLWIAGESYAGVYVPTLARVVSNDPALNFQGIMVGNGVTNWNYDGFQTSLLPLAFSVGLINNATYQTLLSCGASSTAPQCTAAQNVVQSNMADIDIYDLFGDCYHQRPMSNPPRGVPPCTDAFKATDFLNNETVKSAIHVKQDIKWSICSNVINYTSDLLQLPGGMMPIYTELISKNKKILVYSGDTDGAVPHVGTEKWIAALGLNLRGRSWAPWYIPKWDGRQTAGYVTEWQGLTYTTIHGSGHMVPQFRPEAAYYMFSRFIKGQAL
eukprot:TRINITY_DN1683_c0_g1_i1.p1 TRINITY_DN1683_c0_g1~~TRINITY_DN1683_c0_g1_i1.p1  ORF type:complete len:448 (-),score=60.27 TRINITY_DN1683_c0_g1_i1:42-1328(-)